MVWHTTTQAIILHFMQQLEDTEVRILQAIEDGGVLRGNRLRKMAGLKDPTTMISAVKHLLEINLIEVSGSTRDVRAVMSAYFSLVPSTRGLAKRAVKGKP